MSPILGIQQRARELGRIRMGEKGGKGQPVGLDTWRLTSSRKDLLDVAAGLWGGEVTAWKDAPNEGTWQLTTGTNVLPIIIPPGREPVTQWMEQWTAGGCTHRCDTQMNIAPSDPEPCSCDMENPACKATTRLTVALPDLPDMGVWRLESHGWNAALELPTIVEFIRGASERGVFLEGMLRIEHRTSKSEGRTRRFRVPVVDLDMKMRELVSGEGAPAGGGVLATGDRRELAAPEPTVDVDALFQELVEASGVRAQQVGKALRAAGIEGRDALKDPDVLARARDVAGLLREEANRQQATMSTDPDHHSPPPPVDDLDSLFTEGEVVE